MDFDLEREFIEQIQQKCKVKSIDQECLFLVNLRNKEIYVISSNFSEQS
jgi:hypothetical protein